MKKPSLQTSLFERPDEDPFAPITRDKEDRKLLALDIATKTGWCSKSSSGVWIFTPKKGENPGLRLRKFRLKLEEICKRENIRLIVHESPAIYGKFPNFVGVEMIGELKKFCSETGIKRKPYAPSKIQKFATGIGKSNKPLMVKMAKEKYNIDCETDDEADAIHLYHLAIQDLNL